MIVPVPALRPGQFVQLLSSSYPDLPEAAAEAIGGLYSAHQADSDTALGPAVFLGMARYVLAGQANQTSDQAAETQAGPASMGSGSAEAEGVPFDAAQPTSQSTSADTVGEELLAEAYVLGLGRYLAGYDDHVFEDLGVKGCGRRRRTL